MQRGLPLGAVAPGTDGSVSPLAQRDEGATVTGRRAAEPPGPLPPSRSAEYGGLVRKRATGGDGRASTSDKSQLTDAC